MPLAARVAHARLLLERWNFLARFPTKKMIDYGRYEGEDCDGGGFDGRWRLKRENRRFEASVADENRALFPARWGGKNAEKGRGFAL